MLRVDFSALIFTHGFNTRLHCLPAVYKVYTVYIMGDSESDIYVGDLDILKDVGADMNAWIGNLRIVMKFKSHKDVTLEKLSKPGISKELARN